MNILIVEDDYTSRKYMQAILSKIGKCNAISNGLEALEAFKASMKTGEEYDLICLDIMMADMNGFEILKKIRAYESSMGKLGMDKVKVIMTTALGDFENIRNAFSEQCDSYLVKPIDKYGLFNTIESFGFQIK